MPPRAKAFSSMIDFGSVFTLAFSLVVSGDARLAEIVAMSLRVLRLESPRVSRRFFYRGDGRARRPRVECLSDPIVGVFNFGTRSRRICDRYRPHFAHRAFISSALARSPRWA